MAEVIEKVCRHLRGEVQDFRDVAVDPDGASLFARLVYEAARQIPAGQTRTYGELARTLMRPGAARAVGRALGSNPIGLDHPLPSGRGRRRQGRRVLCLRRMGDQDKAAGDRRGTVVKRPKGWTVQGRRPGSRRHGPTYEVGAFLRSSHVGVRGSGGSRTRHYGFHRAACHADTLQTPSTKAEGAGVEPARRCRSPGFRPGAVAHRLALP